MAAIVSNVRHLAIATTPTTGGLPSSYTTISGVSSGLAEISFSKQGTIRDIPGESTNITRQVLTFQDASFSLACDRNDTTRSWLDSSKELSLAFEYGPEGKATGKPRHQFNALVRSRINAPVNEAQTFELTVTVDGAVTSGSFA